MGRSFIWKIIFFFSNYSCWSKPPAPQIHPQEGDGNQWVGVSKKNLISNWWRWSTWLQPSSAPQIHSQEGDDNQWVREECLKKNEFFQIFVLIPVVSSSNPSWRRRWPPMGRSFIKEINFPAIHADAQFCQLGKSTVKKQMRTNVNVFQQILPPLHC